MKAKGSFPHFVYQHRWLYEIPSPYSSPPSAFRPQYISSMLRNVDRLMGAVVGSCEQSDKHVLILDSAESFLTNRVPTGFSKNNFIHGVSFSYLVTSRNIYHTDKNIGFYLAAFCIFLNSLTTENNYVSLLFS